MGILRINDVPFAQIREFRIQQKSRFAADMK